MEHRPGCFTLCGLQVMDKKAFDAPQEFIVDIPSAVRSRALGLAQTQRLGARASLFRKSLGGIWIEEWMSREQKSKSRGTPLRGRGTPAYPARLRSERARNS